MPLTRFLQLYIVSDARAIMCGVLLSCALVFTCATLAKAENDHAAAQHTDKIRPFDTILIHVRDEAELNGAYPVTKDGNIIFPMLGRVSLQDKTEDTAAQHLSDLLHDGYILHPDITLSIKQDDGIYVIGEAKAAGRYVPHNNNTTIANLISLAGGLKTPLSRAKFSVIRTVNGVDYRIKNPDLTFKLKAADVLIIARKGAQ